METEREMKSASTESLKNFPIVVSLLVCFIRFIERESTHLLAWLIQFCALYVVLIVVSQQSSSSFESRNHALSSLQAGQCQAATREWLCRSQYGVGVATDGLNQSLSVFRGLIDLHVFGPVFFDASVHKSQFTSSSEKLKKWSAQGASQA